LPLLLERLCTVFGFATNLPVGPVAQNQTHSLAHHIMVIDY
jgi:hypothetical protein